MNSIYIKLRGVFTNLANDTFNKIIDFYKKEIERKEEKEEKEEKEKSEENNDDEDDIDINLKGEQCLLLCLIITKNEFEKNVKEFCNEISKIINESDNENITKIIKGNFQTECKEINNIIENNLNLIIKNQISKCFNDFLMNSKNDIFLKNYYLISDLISQIISNDDKTKNILIESQQKYINNWKTYKLDTFSTHI